MFYNRYLELCRQKDVSPSRAAQDAGISKSIMTKWKNNRTEILSPMVESHGMILHRVWMMVRSFARGAIGWMKISHP